MSGTREYRVAESECARDARCSLFGESLDLPHGCIEVSQGVVQRVLRERRGGEPPARTAGDQEAD
jgi:hypothetical protein